MKLANSVWLVKSRGGIQPPWWARTKKIMCTLWEQVWVSLLTHLRKQNKLWPSWGFGWNKCAKRMRGYQLWTWKKRYTIVYMKINDIPMSLMPKSILKPRLKYYTMMMMHQMLITIFDIRYNPIAYHIEVAGTEAKQWLVIFQVKALPTKHQESVRHCFQASERISANELCYSHGWLLWCIVLRMTSATPYEYLRRHNALVLPNRPSLRRYR